MRDKYQDITVTEGQVISGIIKFPEFEEFYMNEWKKRDILIRWVVNSTFTEFGYQGSDEKGHYILLSTFPRTLEDAFVVAHEMMHICREFDGQYLKFEQNNELARQFNGENIERLVSNFGSMVDDPIIDKFLQNIYGFKPGKFYTKKRIPASIESLNHLGDPTDDIERLIRALVYSQYLLQWDFITNSNSLRKWKTLRELYKKQRPIVTSIGEEIYITSKEIGYDTLEKQRELFGKFSDKYTINSIKIKDIIRAI